MMPVKRLNQGIILFAMPFLLLSCHSSKQAPATHKEARVAVLQFGSHPVIDQVVDGFKEGLQKDADSIAVKYYNANFDLQTAGMLARQIVSEQNDLIVSITTPATGQMIGANRGRSPLIFTFVSNPPDIGYTGVGSIKNTTGLSDHVSYDSTLLLIRRILPQARNIGYLITRSESNAIAVLKGFEQSAPKFDFRLRVAEINDPADIRTAANALLPNVDLFLFGGDNNIATGISVLISVGRKRGIPTFACDQLSVERGAVAAYSVDYYVMGQRTADMARLVLNRKSADGIPVENFTASELIINEEAAATLSLKIPSSILRSAYRIVK